MAIDSSPDPIVRLTGIKKRFGPVEALRGVDCEIRQGEVVALVGDNGAGKSTLVKILAGVFPPDEGQLSYKGKTVRWRNPRQSRASGIEIVYQDLGLVAPMSIARNFFLGKELTSRLGFLEMAEMRAGAVKGVGELGIRINDPDELVGNLSGGQQKAVAIGRSLYFGVKVLMLDEPTAALSVKETHIVLEVIKSLREKNVAVVFITHNINHAFDVSDRFVVMAAGQKVWDVEKSGVTPQQLTTAIMEGRRPT